MCIPAVNMYLKSRLIAEEYNQMLQQHSEVKHVSPVIFYLAWNAVCK